VAQALTLTSVTFYIGHFRIIIPFMFFVHVTFTMHLMEFMITPGPGITERGASQIGDKPYR